MPTLRLEKVTKCFPAPTGDLSVLAGIDLELAGGESLAIVGPSGSGKSTLLHLIGGLDRPTTGTVRLNDQDLTQLADDDLARVRNQTVGFVFQDHHLLPQCTVLENVLIPTLAGFGGAGNAPRRAAELLEQVGLTDRQHHRPSELSGGQRQRAAIARALIMQPAVILADEPTGNLDRVTAQKVANLFFDLARQQSSILIVVTHSPALAGRLQQQMELIDGTLQPLAAVGAS